MKKLSLLLAFLVSFTLIAKAQEPSGVDTSKGFHFRELDKKTADLTTHIIRPKNKGQLKKLLKEEDAIFLENLEWVILKKTDKLKAIANEVEAVEPNFYVHTTQSVFPNDPLLSNQWGLATIEAPAAWAKTTGKNEVI